MHLIFFFWNILKEAWIQIVAICFLFRKASFYAIEQATRAAIVWSSILNLYPSFKCVLVMTGVPEGHTPEHTPLPHSVLA